MVSSVDSARLSANIAMTSYDFDPGATAATAVTKVDMRDFETFICQFVRTVGTGALEFEIVANTDTTTTGETVVKSATYTDGEPNAVGDYVFLEVDVDELAAVEGGNRYLGARIALATGTDEAVINYVRGNPKRAYSGLCSDNIA